jgi:hypothetical protein
MREMATKELYAAADVAAPALSWPARNAAVVLSHRPRDHPHGSTTCGKYCLGLEMFFGSEPPREP